MTRRHLTADIGMLRLWCMLLAFCGIVKVILAKNVTVSTGQALVSAILDPAVSRITLDSDIRFEAEQWPATPYILKRNLTIDADPSGRHKVSSPVDRVQLFGSVSASS